MSNERNPGCLGYIGDYTTHLCGVKKDIIYKAPHETPTLLGGMTFSFLSPFIFRSVVALWFRSSPHFSRVDFPHPKPMNHLEDGPRVRIRG